MNGRIDLRLARGSRLRCRWDAGLPRGGSRSQSFKDSLYSASGRLPTAYFPTAPRFSESPCSPSSQCANGPHPCPAMNGMHDKRTSISQLLNPSSDSSAFPHPTHLPGLSPPPGVSQYQHLPHLPQGPYPQQPDSGSSFHLRAASWEPVNDDPNAPKRRPDAGPPTGRSYQMPPQMYVEMNGDISQRQPRPGMDGHGNFTMPTGPWPQQPDVSSVTYGSPIVAPMYSDERTCERKSTLHVLVRLPESKSVLSSNSKRLSSKQSVSPSVRCIPWTEFVALGRSIQPCSTRASSTAYSSPYM